MKALVINYWLGNESGQRVPFSIEIEMPDEIELERFASVESVKLSIPEPILTTFVEVSITTKEGDE